ncbi:hypothetical protein A2801_04005 [Candidatus Woesebacteria bacterium RIFCSPHIGHO2_01_FULL_41_10]|uniref:Phosphodiester glycosidase domain-containing protein n=1 Tax=Candidatus Woesebacteria bacterium RIFCSPHIGHO2_01_FULL_41_10 TaxID=1802500 RepID=A0A1F7YQ40_9BACT|nr:MAG: hypothetical protein A2801_04005 [Candidatus Woesebacteria bacterium RIFCSPHIGHO2_01_FULL_41_10]
MPSQQAVFPVHKSKSDLPKPKKVEDTRHFYMQRIEDPIKVYRVVALAFAVAIFFGAIIVASQFDRFSTKNPPVKNVPTVPLYKQAASNDEFLATVALNKQIPKLYDQFKTTTPRFETQEDLTLNSIVSGEYIIAPHEQKNETRIFKLVEGSVEEVTTIDELGKIILIGDKLLFVTADKIAAYSFSDPKTPVLVWEKKFEDANIFAASEHEGVLHVATAREPKANDTCPIIIPLNNSTLSINCDSIWIPADPVRIDNLTILIDVSLDDGAITPRGSLLTSNFIYITFEKDFHVVASYEANPLITLVKFARGDEASVSPESITQIQEIVSGESSLTTQYETLLNILKEDLGEGQMEDAFANFLTAQKLPLYKTYLFTLSSTTGNTVFNSTNGLPLSKSAYQFTDSLALLLTTAGYDTPNQQSQISSFSASLKQVNMLEAISDSNIRSVTTTPEILVTTHDKTEEAAKVFERKANTITNTVTIPRTGTDSFVIPISSNSFINFQESSSLTKLTLFTNTEEGLISKSSYDLNESWEEVKAIQAKITLDLLSNVVIIPGKRALNIINVSENELKTARTLSPVAVESIFLQNDTIIIVVGDRIIILDKKQWEILDTFLFSPPPPPVVTQNTSETTSAPVFSGAPGAGHSRYTIGTEVGSFLVDVVSINMAGVRMITDTAADHDCADNCPRISLADYVSRNGGFAGINGTYFCPQDYSSCAGKVNSFDFPVYNTRLAKWINGGNLFWNDRSVLYQDGGGMRFLRNANAFGGGLNAGIVNHPGLLENGNVIAEQFPLTDVQRSKGTKGGIGFNGNTVYLVIGRSVTMTEFAHVFKSLGAQFALNLDGGGSTALWYGGYKVGPGRDLPNAVIFAR